MLSPKKLSLVMAVICGYPAHAADVNAELGATPHTGKGPVQYALELPANHQILALRSSLSGANWPHQIAIIGDSNGITPTSSEPFFAKLSLQGGAIFDNNASRYGLGCYRDGVLAGSGGVVVGGDNNYATTLSISTATGPLNVQSSGCLIAFGSKQVNAPATALIRITGHADIRVAGHVEYWNGTQVKASQSFSAPLITFRTGLFDRYHVTQTAISIHARFDMKKLSPSGTVTEHTANIGWLRYGNTGNRPVYNLSGSLIEASTLAGDQLNKEIFSITVTGAPLIAAHRVMLVEGINADDCVGDIRKSALGNRAVHFSGITANILSGGIKVCVTYDGTQSIPAGQTYASISVSGAAPNYHPRFKGGKLARFFVDGASRYFVGGIPNASQGDVAFIRFYNDSDTATAKVFGTLRNQDRTMVGQGRATLATIPPNGSVALCGVAKPSDPSLVEICKLNNLESQVGGLIGEGRASLYVDFDTPGRVQMLIRSPSGTLTNLSTMVTPRLDSTQ